LRANGISSFYAGISGGGLAPSANLASLNVFDAQLSRLTPSGSDDTWAQQAV